MESIRTLYKIGRGPSSSHTMGPDIASRKFKEKNKDADHFKVYLYHEYFVYFGFYSIFFILFFKLNCSSLGHWTLYQLAPMSP